MLGLVGSGRIGLKVVLEWVSPPRGAPRPPGVALERGLLVPRTTINHHQHHHHYQPPPQPSTTIKHYYHHHAKPPPRVPLHATPLSNTGHYVPSTTATTGTTAHNNTNQRHNNPLPLKYVFFSSFVFFH